MSPSNRDGEPIGDDAFVRTAIRGLRPPEHREDFWDRLADGIGGVEDELGAPVPAAPPAVEARGPARRAASHPPRRTPLRADRAPEPVEEDLVRETARRVYVDAPAGATDGALPTAVAAAVRPDAGDRLFQGWAAEALVAGAADRTGTADRGVAPAADRPPATRTAGRAVRPVPDPLERFSVHHDDATVPFSMRRASNAVLVAIAVAAAVVAVVAGLSLVQQRNDAGAPPSVDATVDAPGQAEGPRPPS